MPKFDFFDASQTICSLKFGTAPGTRAMPPKKKKKDDGPVEEVRRVEIDRIAAQLPGPVLPVYLDLIESDPPVGTADPIPVPAPELDEGPHLSYAVQWFIFSVCVVVGWALAVRTSTRNRRRKQAAEGDAVMGARHEAGAGDPMPADGGATASPRSGTTPTSSG